MPAPPRFQPANLSDNIRLRARLNVNYSKALNAVALFNILLELDIFSILSHTQALPLHVYRLRTVSLGKPPHHRGSIPLLALNALSIAGVAHTQAMPEGFKHW